MIAPADRVPTADEVLSPGAEPSLDGVDSTTLATVINSYVDEYFDRLVIAQHKAFKALEEVPSPPPDSAARAILEQIVTALSTFILGGLASAVFGQVEDKIGADARTALSRHLAMTGSLGAARGVIAGSAPRAPVDPPAPATPFDPAAKTLLDEFQSRQVDALRGERGRAHRLLLVAGDAMRRAHPSELRRLADVLGQKVIDPAIPGEYTRRVCTDWMQLTSQLALGPRKAGEPAMPDANRVGGSVKATWRHAHAGFLEVVLDVPDELDGLDGIRVTSIGVASGPGAARILRQSRGRIGDLPVYRRLWLGTHALDRRPDLVVTPEHALEVNAGSSVLAIIGMRGQGRFTALAAEGPAEEAERTQLLDHAPHGSAPRPAIDPGDGPLAALPNMVPQPGERTIDEERRLVGLSLRRNLRAAAAQQGAQALWAMVSATPNDRIGT